MASPMRYAVEFFWGQGAPTLARRLAVFEGYDIVAEATNPNTGETGIVVDFPTEEAAIQFQVMLAKQFGVVLSDMDEKESGYVQ